MTEPNPTRAEIVAYMRDHPGDVADMVERPSGKPIFPGELWLEGLAAWLRVDGSAVCGDRARGHTYFGNLDAFRLRRAVKIWRQQK